jgi:hypothetical protein
VNYWEIIADNLKKAGWRCGCISSTDHKGRQFWIVAAERGDAGRFIVHADEMLTAFLELQAGIHRQQSQESRLEFGSRRSRRFRTANNLRC